MKHNIVTLLALCITYASAWAQSSSLAIGFAEQKLAGGLNPTALAQSPDGRVFVVEKNGIIQVLRNDTLLEKPFLSIDVDTKNERGLLGLAFSPGFPGDPYFYVYYTVPDSNFNRVSRFQASGDTSLMGSETVIIELKTGLTIGNVHQGGQMQFGPDGKLYIAVGDGSLGLEAQVVSNVLGTILRINPDGSIPSDNPFYNQVDGIGRSIWALGLRNPYTFAFQPGQNKIFTNDVGSNKFEEINVVEAGLNFGWPLIEGFRDQEPIPENYRDPIYAFGRKEGCSVIGATFYAPSQATFPELYHNKYLFGDYCLGYIKVMDPATGNVLTTLTEGITQLVAILAHDQGDVYYLGRGANKFDAGGNTGTTKGSLWKISYVGSGVPNISIHPSPLTIPLGEDATFSVKASGKLPLSYQWFKDSLEIPNAVNAVLNYARVSLADDSAAFYCKVSNDEGESFSETAILRVTQNTRPQAQIISPVLGTKYKAGQVLQFKGSASDMEDSTVDLTWRIDLHHDTHTHPALAPVSGIAEGTYVVPTVDHKEDLNVWLRVYLQAKDQEGLSRTVFRDIFPEKTQIHLETNPQGLKVKLEGKSVNAPFPFESVVGMERTVEAFLAQFFRDSLWLFQNWSADIGEYQGQRVDFSAGEPTTSITANYALAPIGQGKGLLGEYFQNEFEGEPLISRIDPVIDFNWRGKSPDTSLFRPDFYKVRWTGFIESQLTDTFTFHMLIDDGARLWIDDTLVVDEWIQQGVTEVAGSKFLEAGKRVPIRLEYFEHGFLASVSLAWSTPIVSRHIIPSTQLYPPTILEIPEIPEMPLTVFPVPATEQLIVQANPFPYETISIRVIDMLGKEFLYASIPIQDQQLDEKIELSRLTAGVFILEISEVSSGKLLGVRKFVKYE